ncbi:MAG: protein translocase subunit SecF, partial [Synechococcaceae cyanobacterium]|nr:protein translocase subunit SecF [Synechococcaceae cyanobacterium]
MNPSTGLSALASFGVNRHRRLVWGISLLAVLLSLIGMGLSWSRPGIRAPLRPGLDFTGGTQIQIQRSCGSACAGLGSTQVQSALAGLRLAADGGRSAPRLDGAGVQLLDGGRTVLLRLPDLSAGQTRAVVQGLEPLLGPPAEGGLSIDTIGPTLGGRLLRSSLISLLVSFIGIALYITFR